MKNLLIAMSVLLLACCGTKQTSEIPVLDVTKSYPGKEVVLQDVADVEYVVLESADNFLVDYPTIGYIDDDILMMYNQGGDIMTFDRRTGKALHSFNRTGRGPGEYNAGIHSLAVDAKNKEIFVTMNSLSGSTPVYIYDFQGNHIRTLRFGTGWFPSLFHNYDDDHIMMYNDDMSMPEPYKLMSKTDTLFTMLPLRFEGREKMSLTQKVEGGSSTYSAGHNVLTNIPGGYMISETGIDTMYRWNTATGTLTPVMTRTPAFHSMEFPIGLYYDGESSDYMFLSTVERKYDFETNEGFETKHLIYDKAYGRFYEGGIVNGDIENGWELYINGNLGLPPGVVIVSYQPYQLMDWYDEGKLHGFPAELIASGRLREDDNPVLMIATLKQ